MTVCLLGLYLCKFCVTAQGNKVLIFQGISSGSVQMYGSRMVCKPWIDTESLRTPISVCVAEIAMPQRIRRSSGLVA